MVRSRYARGRSWCGRGTRYACGAVEVRSWYGPGAVEVCSWYGPGAVEVQYARGAVEVYAHGAVEVRSWCMLVVWSSGRGTLVVRSWCGRGTLVVRFRFGAVR